MELEFYAKSIDVQPYNTKILNTVVQGTGIQCINSLYFLRYKNRWIRVDPDSIQIIKRKEIELEKE